MKKIKKPPPFFFLLLSTTAIITSFSAAASSDLILSLSPAEIRLGGSWDLLHSSIGISAMHMQLLPTNHVIIFDSTNMGPSNLSLPYYQHDTVPLKESTAHSLLYDVVSHTIRPLTLKSDTWCSSGSLNSTGSLIQTGGYRTGDRTVRVFTPCFQNDRVSCDWIEHPASLSSRRWYAANLLLHDGRIIVVGGRRSFTYEFYPKNAGKSLFFLRFLAETRDRGEENNLYPFLHLLPDGNLFIFANRRSISFDYIRHRVVKEFPTIPGGHKRNYPSTGSSVLLPLHLDDRQGRIAAVEVLVCGGAPAGSFFEADKKYSKVFLEASRTCGRLKVMDKDPRWEMEVMPTPRVMPDMIILPTGDVIIINGAAHGTAGWEHATKAVLNPVLYLPEKDPTRRFLMLAPTRIPRMYHSTAVLSPDGRILVGGSNPHRFYNFTVNPYPTELSLEAYSPYYLYPRYRLVRPKILTVSKTVGYRRVFVVTFLVRVYGREIMERGVLSIRLVAPSFSTHSTAMNQRMVVLRVRQIERLSVLGYKADVDGPVSAYVAPPGYYMLFVVHRGIPSEAVWVNVARW